MKGALIMTNAEIGKYIPYLIYLAVIIWVLYRQIVPREVKEKLTLYVLLIVAGAYIFFSAIRSGQMIMDERAIGIIALSLIVFTIGLGVLRGLSCRLWIKDGSKMRRGTVLTFIFWLITMGAHFYLGSLVKGSSATILLSLGLSLCIQQMVVIQRANSMTATADTQA